ncbi:MAG: NADH-quinone oxidoreductase subunit A [Verrucomicrobia bacterium]|nr:NADH-quinone oxidoreductase subunit A [Verrucomicrobiota bacterium]
MEEHPYLFLAVLAGTALVFCLTPLLIARAWAAVFNAAKPGEVKQQVYECGVEAKGDSWVRFHVGYYRYAIVFLVLDVEALFLLPFAVAFGGLSWGASVVILLFLLLAVEGLVWAWKRGALEWA